MQRFNVSGCQKTVSETKYYLSTTIERPTYLSTLTSSQGRVAQSVGHPTHKSGVLGSIPGLATYFLFLLPLFQEGQLSVTGESMCTKYWLTA